jgi:2-methylcitrate dehydratase PrpD
MNITDKLTDYLIDTNFTGLPSDVVEITKKQILDTLGVTVAGSTCSIAGEMNGLANLVKSWGGREESTIIAFGGRVPAPNAAFVNAISSVRLDFDDTLVTWINLHISRAIVPAALAMAECLGNVNGKSLITAVALGYDLSCRIKQAAGYNADNAVRFTSNFFGAAAAAARLLGLDHEKFRNALFLAFHQMCGAGSAGGGGIGAGSTLKGLSNGFAAKAGILSAQLAEIGFAAESDFLDAGNMNNYYHMFCNGSYLPWVLTLDLGKKFAGSNTSLKEYPCCHGQHAGIEAALGLMKDNRLNISDIKEIIVHHSPLDTGLLNPLESKQNPQNAIETQFSLCWGVASAIVLHEVGIKNFSKESLKDSRICDLARKVSGKLDMAMAREQGFPACAIDIITSNGSVYSRQVDHAYGTVGNPMKQADVISKFKYCCGYSTKPIPSENQDKVIKMVAELEKIDDAGGIVRLLG